MARARARIAALLLALGVLAGGHAHLAGDRGARRVRRRAVPPRPAPTSAPPRSGRPTSAPASTSSSRSARTEVDCRNATGPGAPDSGLAGWFASRPDSAKLPGPKGLYSDYGYAGYSYNTYDVDGGCASSVLHPDYKFTTTVANGEFMIATAVIGASNALRERAWDPAVDVGLGRSAGGAGDQGRLPEGVQRLRHHHALRGGALPALALPPVGHEQRDDHGRLGAAGDGGGDRAGRLAGEVRQHRRRHPDHHPRRRTRRGRPARQGHPAGPVRRSRIPTPARTTGRRRSGPATLPPRRCSTGTGCAACSARRTARPPRSTARRSTTPSRSPGRRRRSSAQNPATREATIKAKQQQWTTRRRADQDRGPGGVRVPPGHPGHGPDRRRLHRGARRRCSSRCST